MPGTPSLEDLVRAICEGTPIDWDALEQDASAGFHHKLAALRVVETIARVHRTAGTERGGLEGASADTTAEPTRWGPLELLEHLASGAFGDVYRAWDPGLDREVALKLLRRSPDADAHADEALEEGRLLAKVRHPNIVTVYGAARFGGRAGIWMEFVRGRTLAELVTEDGPLAPERVASIGVALCHALSAVHAASLVHRDVKAQNVMVGDDGRIVLMDFGAGSTVRHAGLQHAGTPRYLAPEVAAGGPATIQSDIYSLGVMLQYLLAGRFADRTELAPKGRIDRRLLQAIARATAPDPHDRFESAAAFARALAACAGRRWSAVAASVTATLALASLVVLGLLLRAQHSEEASRRAIEQAWQAATPARAPLTPDQSQRLGGPSQSTFSLHGVITGVTGNDPDRESLVTFDPRSGDSRVWLSYSRSTAHIESQLVSPDDSSVWYVWQDHACRCASLRTVDRAGQVRVVVSAPEIIAMEIGASSARRLPVLIGREGMQFELAAVDIDTAVKQTLRTLQVNPSAFSISPDGRFVALAMARHSEPGSAHDIVVHEVSTGREWPLLDTAGDRHRSLPVWSPEGGRVLYLETGSDGTTLRAVPVLDGRRSSSPAVLRRDLGEPGSMGFLDADTFGYAVNTGSKDVMVVEAGPDGRFDGQTPRRIRDAMMPAWSPDGRWLAWSDFRRTGGVRVEDRDGRVTRAFKPSVGVQVNPAWSHDSKRLAFWDVNRLSAVLTVADVEGGTTRDVLRLTHPAFEGAYELAWMSGGRELLIPKPNKIVALDLATGRQREVHAVPPGHSGGPYYVSPNGHSMVFCEGIESPAPIHVVPLGPRGMSRVRPASRADAEALFGWWSDTELLETRAPGHPEGTYQDEVWRVPLSGEPPEPLGIKATNIVYMSGNAASRRIAYNMVLGGSEFWLLTPGVEQ